MDDVDSLFKQNLQEWIYDDNKLVTYQYLSISLGVHVNIAKQMLYEFHKEQLEKQELRNNNKTGSDKRIHALYYVAGLTAQPDSDKLAYSTMICREDKLESLKKKFNTLTSLHIYALEVSETVMEHDTEFAVKKLTNAMKEVSLMTENEEDSHVKFGPFQGRKPCERKSEVVDTNNTVEDVKPESKPKGIVIKKEVKEEKCPTSKEEKLKNFKNEDIKLVQKNKSNGHADVAESSSQKNKNGENSTSKKNGYTKSGSTNEKSNRLMNMFAAAAAKPAKPKKEKVEPESTSHNKNRNTKTKTKKIQTKRESEGSRKRKRVKDIFSSEDEESESGEEEKLTKKVVVSSSEDDEDFKKTPNEKHRQRIRMLIDSESDEDESFKTPPPRKSTPPQKKSAPPPLKKSTPPPVQPAKKMRKTKVVTTQVMDEEGYLVTKKEKVSASESDGDDDDSTPRNPKPSKDEQHTSSKQSTKPQSDQKKNFLSSPPPPTLSKKSRSTPSSKQNSVAPKTKQATLMSFFVKKSGTG